MSLSGWRPSPFLSSTSSSTHRGPCPTSWWLINQVQRAPLLSVSSSCKQALVPVLLCLSCWLRDLHTGFLLTASFAILIFRSVRIPKCQKSSFSLVGYFLSRHFQFLGANWLSFWGSSFWWSFLLGEYLSKGAHTQTFLHWSRWQGWSWSVSSLSYSGHPSLWWSTPTFGDAQLGQRWTIRIFGWFFTIFFRLRLCTTMFTWTRVVIGELCHHYGQFELETFALSDEVGHQHCSGISTLRFPEHFSPPFFCFLLHLCLTSK